MWKVDNMENSVCGYTWKVFGCSSVLDNNRSVSYWNLTWMGSLGNPSCFVAGLGDTGSLHRIDSPSSGLVDKASSRDSNGLNVVVTKRLSLYEYELTNCAMTICWLAPLELLWAPTPFDRPPSWTLSL
jgi:hypothetical protein